METFQVMDQNEEISKKVSIELTLLQSFFLSLFISILDSSKICMVFEVEKFFFLSISRRLRSVLIDLTWNAIHVVALKCKS